MKFVALDLSVRSTGFAWWKEGQALPSCGTWELAPHVDYAARAFVRLHARLNAIHQTDPIDELVFEEAIPAHQLHGGTNATTLFAGAGLAAHAMSFCEALGIRWRSVPIRSWRKHFIGSVPRGTKTPDFKHMSMSRCRELGFDVQKHDAAEAAGLLDYQLSVAGILPPWRESNVLQREMMPATDGKAVV